MSKKSLGFILSCIIFSFCLVVGIHFNDQEVNIVQENQNIETSKTEITQPTEVTATTKSERIKEYNKDGYVTHVVTPHGHEYWYDRDEQNRQIHYYDSEGFESWYEYFDGKAKRYTNTNGAEVIYDEEGRITYQKDDYGIEVWFKYGEDGSITRYGAKDKTKGLI